MIKTKREVIEIEIGIVIKTEIEIIEIGKETKIKI